MTRLKEFVQGLIARLGKPRPAPQPPRAAKHRVPVFVELPELEDDEDYGRSAYN